MLLTLQHYFSFEKVLERKEWPKIWYEGVVLVTPMPGKKGSSLQPLRKIF
jgi:hypothetical protein